MNYQEFLLWLVNERKMALRSAKDVVSRLKRVTNILGTDVIDDATSTNLSNSDEFKQYSMFIKSQLRRSIALYLEYNN